MPEKDLDLVPVAITVEELPTVNDDQVTKFSLATKEITVELWEEDVKKNSQITRMIVMLYPSGFQPGFPGSIRLHQHIRRVPPEVIPMLGSTLYFSCPVQICEQGFRKPLECTLRVPLYRKG